MISKLQNVLYQLTFILAEDTDIQQIKTVLNDIETPEYTETLLNLN